jgi:hypothetical protein
MDRRMNPNRFIYGIVGAVLTLSLCLSAHPDSLHAAQAASGNAPQQPAAGQQEDSGLTILNDSPLPDASPLGYYEVHLLARGGAAPFQWRLEKGALPPGIQLDPNGLIRGEARSGGEFHFTVSVRDASNERARKDFIVLVHSALELTWKTMAHVNGNRIDGSVEITNATHDDIDLTFVALAVAPNGRATAIGYQHFRLRRGTKGQALPFGDTIAHGTYVVYVDAVGEVAPKNLIYRERLQTRPLDVTAGP